MKLSAADRLFILFLRVSSPAPLNEQLFNWGALRGCNEALAQQMDFYKVIKSH